MLRRPTFCSVETREEISVISFSERELRLVRFACQYAFERPDMVQKHLVLSQVEQPLGGKEMTLYETLGSNQLHDEFGVQQP